MLGGLDTLTYIQVYLESCRCYQNENHLSLYLNLNPPKPVKDNGISIKVRGLRSTDGILLQKFVH